MTSRGYQTTHTDLQLVPWENSQPTLTTKVFYFISSSNRLGAMMENALVETHLNLYGFSVSRIWK